MKNIFFASLLLLSVNSFASNLLCSLKVNLETIDEREIEVSAKEKVNFTDYENYRFFITNNSNDQYTIEVFDGDTPSRSYATGILKNQNDSVKWSLWTRDIILDADCSLL